MLNIAVFFGGKSSEHDVSVVTALQIIRRWQRPYVAEYYPYLYNQRRGLVYGRKAYRYKYL